MRLKIGVPALNRGDLLEKLIRSVDMDAHVVVVVNRIGPTDPSIERALGELQRSPMENIELDIHRVNGNLGVSGSWNYLMDAFGGNCFIANSDIEFTPATLSEAVSQIAARRHIVLQHLLHWACFYVTEGFTSALGWFDENLYPAYHEDQEMSARAALLKVERCGFWNLQGRILHAESQTIRSATGEVLKFLRRATQVGEDGRPTSSFVSEYFGRRWGPLPLGRGTALPKKSHPFDDPSLGAYDWTLDLDFRRRICETAEAITGHECPIVYHRCKGGLAC